MTVALAHVKCQVIFYITTKDEMSDFGSFAMLSFYISPLELVHCVVFNTLFVFKTFVDYHILIWGGFLFILYITNGVFWIIHHTNQCYCVVGN